MDLAVVLAYPRAEDRYEGTVRGKVPKPHGRGTCVYASGGCGEDDGELPVLSDDGVIGGRYEGDWVDGKRQGKGTMWGTYGEKYEGCWVNGKKEGKGTMSTYGGRYEGDWVEGKKQGKGVQTRRNGYKYLGNFVNGEPSGEGELIDSKGTVVFKGIWKEGVRF
jgi:hypothetical protein